MRVGLTGATGFLGRYLVTHLAGKGHHCRCWYRLSSDRRGLETIDHSVTWMPGELGDAEANWALVEGCDAVVHAALYRPDASTRGKAGELLKFAKLNILGTIGLIEAARAAGVRRFVFISTCAVHEKILEDRPLDETHPLWPASHYGAHKAALEAFVHSYGLGEGYPICALRPTGIYGLAHPPQRSKWFDLVRSVVRNETVECSRGGKEVHAADVARAIDILLAADGIAGEVYNCYDRYVSDYQVATIAKELSGSRSEIRGEQIAPKHQIDTRKLTALGMQFGGLPRLEQTIRELIDASRSD
jgi:nucleoside-diphosphate-sugar epimerase